MKRNHKIVMFKACVTNVLKIKWLLKSPVYSILSKIQCLFNRLNVKLVLDVAIKRFLRTFSTYAMFVEQTQLEKNLTSLPSINVRWAIKQPCVPAGEQDRMLKSFAQYFCLFLRYLGTFIKKGIAVKPLTDCVSVLLKRLRWQPLN